MPTESFVFHRVVLMVSMLGVLAAPARGQSVIDPTNAEFTASVDHDATGSDGTPVVSGYSLEFYLSGATAPFQTQPLDKPVPGAGGLIRVPLTSAGAMPTGMVYEARVRAVGPGGSSASEASNSFMFSVTCSYSVSPAAHDFGATGGTGSSAVATGAGCTWGATSSASWIVIASSVSSNGPGSVDFSVSPNGTSTPRTGTLTIGGQTVTVTQAGTTPCSYTVNTSPTSFPATGGSGTATVTAGSGCSWTAASGSSWITVGAAGGSGSGTVGFTVAAHSATTSRQGTLTIAGQPVAITQAAATSCAFTLSPTSQSFGSAGGTGTGSVSTTSTCAWSATSGASWITVSAGAGGTGPGSFGYTVAGYSGTGTRTGTIAVGGSTLAITQSSAGTCTATVTPPALALGGQSAAVSIAVSVGAGCAWTAQSSLSWATISSGAAGAGAGVVTLAVSKNPGNQTRSGTISVAGQTISVTQSGSANGGGPKKPNGFRVVG
jgi:hypothetical protein